MTPTRPVQFEGTLGDGTEWSARRPAHWNGVLINDMDYRTRADEAHHLLLNEQGYATAGTARPAWRRHRYDNVAERANQVAVIDLFRKQVGRPDMVLQFGYSGGGLVAEAMAELCTDVIDGAIVGAAHDNIALAEQYLDLLFVLRTLLDPDGDLPVSGIPDDATSIAARWEELVDGAQSTPQGRARTALATAIAQFPTWGAPGTVKPDPADVQDVRRAMHETVRYAIGFIVGNNYMFEHTAGGNPASNVGVDYATFLRNADHIQHGVVRELYLATDLSLNADLDQLAQAPRVANDPAATDYYLVPGRTPSGRVGVPVLRVHETGDAYVPPTVIESYGEQIRLHRRESLYRDAVLDRAGHTTLSAAEVATVVGVLRHRITDGAWGDTTAAALNALGDRVRPGESTFVAYQPPRANRGRYLD